jgi:phosphonate transport system ATP-binding protein
MTSRSSSATEVVAPATRAAASTGEHSAKLTAIEVANLSVRYRRNTAVALSSVDLRVADGETVALIGTNGAGKSTLLRCLVRLIEPAEGAIIIGGVEVTGAPRRTLREIRQDVGFVFQRFHLLPRLTAFHNVVHGAMGRHGSRSAWPVTASTGVRRQAMDCLDRVGLAANAGRRVDTLSGGQQQRVAIARMLMQQPRVILADEPVASLDPASANSVMDLMCEIAAERGVTVIVALHQIDLALRYTDRVVGLRNGVVEFDGATRDCDPAQLASIYAEAPS